MTFNPTRRQVLVGGASIATIVAFGGVHPAVANEDRTKIAVRVEKDLSNLDPANRSGPVDLNVIWSVQQGLISFKPGSTEWELDAAEELEQVSDTEIRFKLRSGLAFTGGYGDLTAEDVKFSFERFIKPDSEGKPVTYAKDWSALDRVEVTGPLEGRIILKNPAPALYTIALADGSGRILSKKAFEALGEKAIATKLIGSGPYVLKEWTPREQFVLEINPDYKGAIKPHFLQIVGKPIGEQKTAEIAFQSGEIDFTAIDPESGKALAELPDASVTQIPAIDYVWFGPNIEKAPFDDIRVRQALRYAVDIDAILQGAYSGIYPRANSLLAPSLLGYWKDAPVHARDLEKAQALLAEAGHADGFKTKLTIEANARYEAIAQIIQANLAEVGIEVEIEALESAAYWALGENDASKDLELSLIKYNGKFDPGFQTQWFTSAQVGQWNWQRWKSADFDALHEKGGVTVDPAEREKIYIEAQKLLDESAAFIWITHNLNAFASRKWLKPGVLPNGNNWLYTAFTEATA
ncbi:peptide/nickel transport system substrate-binding protein [Pararhizobium capsulatum DSM 1112]|uniref:Peptide/nickel transport system substrate-binding protein n=1 Tax=Pararhizobium capsulatum DSM 1112 TaxID=1121113 RepID=A0ABU0BWG5_9HYPH|nr:ABC transporter substrate-binding protein [Pararhizobium capsulatum]MDQ0322011.1 peptide/nickel transport system substrate-binding protein [Pararhizobium capsulatum DSM 1112]